MAGEGCEPMSNVFQELKRRNVFRVGVGYLVLSWLILQIGAVLAPILGLPDIVLSFVVFALVLGLPLAIVFAWAYELTPEGIKRSGDVAPDASVAASTGKRLNVLITGTMGFIIALLLVDRFVFSDHAPSEHAIGKEGVLGERSYDSIAVLPFVNMSDDASQEFFSDGISEELLNLLAKTRGLRVAARTSSFAFKGQNQDIKSIGAQLDVETILEGSVRKADTRLRITAQLIDVASGYHLWSETYDRELTDVFAVQDEISASIVNALQVHFGEAGAPAEPSQSYQADVEAYEHYLMGRRLIEKRTKQDIEAALEHFSQSIEIDPGYGPPYSGKADAYMLLSDRNGAYGDIPKKYAIDLAEPLIERALTLDPLLAEAHNSKGFLLHTSEKLDEALTSFDRAIELRPSYGIAHMWRSQLFDDMNREKKAKFALEEAYRIDPLSLVILRNLIFKRMDFNDREGAERLLLRLEEIAPERDDYNKSIRTAMMWSAGDFSEAWTILQEVVATSRVPQARFMFARLLLDLKNFDGALKYIPERGKVFIHLTMGDYEGAMTAWEARGQNFRESKDGLLQLSNIRFVTRDFDRALEALESAKLDLTFAGDLFSDNLDNIDAPGYTYLMQKLGRQDEATRVLKLLDQYIENLVDDGLGHNAHLVTARTAALRGDAEGALEALLRAEAEHDVLWHTRDDILFEDLKDRPEFVTLFDRVDARVNAERAELGWGPMETR